jgi:hypothetical protein
MTIPTGTARRALAKSLNERTGPPPRASGGPAYPPGIMSGSRAWQSARRPAARRTPDRNRHRLECPVRIRAPICRRGNHDHAGSVAVPICPMHRDTRRFSALIPAPLPADLRPQRGCAGPAPECLPGSIEERGINVQPPLPPRAGIVGGCALARHAPGRPMVSRGSADGTAAGVRELRTPSCGEPSTTSGGYLP